MAERIPLVTIAREWGRIGCIGFGGPPAHIALLRRRCVDDRGWLSPREFEHGVAATNLLPGPASTQLAIYCAWRLRATAGAVVGGVCFIVPGLVLILALAAVFLAARPPLWVAAAAAGAGAAVPAVALHAALGLLGTSRRRTARTTAARARWVGHLAAGGVAAAVVGPWLVVVLGGCGLVEVAAHSHRPPPSGHPPLRRTPPALLATSSVHALAAGGLGAVVWVALKIGLLSYGGGFVIVPLMQHDAVHTYHWMTGAQFLGAVALGQVTPGPVVLTVAVVGFAAGGVGGGLLAAVTAFTPSFLFVVAGARRFEQLRADSRVQAFLTGAGATAIGAIAGSAVPLALALSHLWQLGVLGLAGLWLLALRRPVVPALIGAAIIGVIAAHAGAPVSR